VGGAFDTPAHWAALTAVLRAAAAGVHAACPAARVVVHLAAGGDRAACVRTLDRLVAAHVPFDVIGLSYYPWWHGSLEALRANMTALAGRYQRDVMVVETAYPWTLGWFDSERNLVGSPGQLLPGFPATPAGQAAFARALRRVVEDVPEGRGAGVWWWEPAWIAAPRGGSPWENCALFDSSGAALPALRAFAR
jgi:arabinogalactan endo-1,4-beta-galactosidase